MARLTPLQLRPIVLDLRNTNQQSYKGEGGYLIVRSTVWCRHCLQYLNPEESVAHVNMFRATRTCMTCGSFCYLDETEELIHHCSGGRIVDYYPTDRPFFKTRILMLETQGESITVAKRRGWLLRLTDQIFGAIWPR